MGVKVLRPSGRRDWYIQVCEGGERYLRHAGSREATFAAKKEIEASLATGTFRKPEKKAEKGNTFGEAAKRWRKEHIELRLKPSTKKYYADFVKDFLNPFFGDMPLADITRRNVKRRSHFGWSGYKRARASEASGPFRTHSIRVEPSSPGRLRRNRQRSTSSSSPPRFLRWNVQESLPPARRGWPVPRRREEEGSEVLPSSPDDDLRRVAGR